LRFSLSFLNMVSDRLGEFPWSLSGGINMRLLMWVHRLLVDTGEIPKDSTPTWAWPDPSIGQICVLVFSPEFELAKEGEPVPYLEVLIDREAFDAACQRDCPPHLRKAVCSECGRRKMQLLAEGHKPGCSFGAGEVDHGQHGRGAPDGGPDDPDCPCRGSVLEVACAAAGCGFCVASLEKEEG